MNQIEKSIFDYDIDELNTCKQTKFSITLVVKKFEEINLSNI